MDYAALIKEVGRGARGARNLDRADAAALFGAMLDGQVPELELGALLLALRIKGESADELLGFSEAMNARCQRLHVPGERRLVLLPSFNGARKLANLMPLIALRLADEGIPVLIHGRHDFSARENPFELLEALGLRCAASLEEAQEQLQQRRLAVLPSVLLLPGLDRLMALRVRLGVRNSAHSLAKLLDPAPGHSTRVVAVTHPEYITSMSALLPALCQNTGGTALLMKGCEGEAHAHLRRKAWLMQIDAGGSCRLHEDLEDDCQALLEQSDIAGNAQLIDSLLHGRLPMPRRIAEQLEALTQLSQY
ncbi:DNA-binding protein YbiB [Paucibacter sp. APW11]|uniref:DNA-binding protein YbiB n=1 Tax=Roseateles aquae TaxID=3077235 RepID=A0ABU3PCZ0_9BURK|nr:DNA-binding protein YbiB [Paucibacter sp. APW11]MDT9000465.1 DNA-binding protein YbiB [Paucibacter sp. APW11]